MKTYLIHTQTIGGHQLEYLHHLYEWALRTGEHQYVFVVPSNFKEDATKLQWCKADHVTIVEMSADEEVPQNSGILLKGWKNSKIVRKYVSIYHATDVIVITMMEYLPFLPLFINSKVRVRGIVYRIYLYEWFDESRTMRWLDALKYLILSRCKVFNRIFICNDSASPSYLNRLYHTSKFRYMPDPVGSLIGYEGKNIRKELGISQSELVFLHPGSMNSYKNSLGVLRALCMLDEKNIKKPVVVFAGQVRPGIRKEFDELYKKAQNHARLYLLEGYMPFERLADLFVSCDYVLIPYSVKGQSSGIVGHAAYYGKPVVVVKGGVIGKIVRKWKLGSQLTDCSEGSICCFINSVLNIKPVSTKGNSYFADHTKDLFCKVVFDD